MNALIWIELALIVLLIMGVIILNYKINKLHSYNIRLLNVKIAELQKINATTTSKFVAIDEDFNSLKNDVDGINKVLDRMLFVSETTKDKSNNTTNGSRVITWSDDN